MVKLTGARASRVTHRRSQEHTGKELVAMNERHAKTCRKCKCRYFKADVTFEGVEIRLFFIQYGKSNDWHIILATDRSLSFVKAFEYYQIRWNTEVMYL